MELLIAHHLGTPITLPWKAETVEEEEKKKKLVVEESNKQGKPSTSVKQDGVKLQNFGFVLVNNAGHGTLREISISSDKLYGDGDNCTQQLQITQDHKQTNKHKRKTRIPKKRADNFLWT